MLLVMPREGTVGMPGREGTLLYVWREMEVEVTVSFLRMNFGDGQANP